jgi:outer membrane protein
MKRAQIIPLSFLIIVLSSNVLGQDQLKIGHVDMNEIISMMPESDSAQSLLEKDSRELETMLENMQVEYNIMLDKYQQNLDSYSQMIRQTKESELLEMQNKIQAFQQSASQQLQQRNYELMQPIYTRIQEAIDKIATQEGFTYILDISRGSVVFSANNSQNINSLVLSELGVRN